MELITKQRESLVDNFRVSGVHRSTWFDVVTGVVASTVSSRATNEIVGIFGMLLAHREPANDLSINRIPGLPGSHFHRNTCHARTKTNANWKLLIFFLISSIFLPMRRERKTSQTSIYKMDDLQIAKRRLNRLIEKSIELINRDGRCWRWRRTGEDRLNRNCAM